MFTFPHEPWKCFWFATQQTATAPAGSEVSHRNRTWSSIVELGESESPTPLGDPSLSGGYPLLPCREARRGIDSTTANGLAALVGKRAFGINAVTGSAKDLARGPHSRPGWIFPLRPANRWADPFHCLAHFVQCSRSPHRRFVS